ncbi:phage minor capsid protein [Helcococcus kunzii]|uniref:phage minor capsid protein n=1 Tax=Helcococcus kunzii TaxID=40091 RepID=UPI0038A744D4
MKKNKNKNNNALEIEKTYREIEQQIIIITASYLNIEGYSDVNKWHNDNYKKIKQYERDVQKIVISNTKNARDVVDDFIDEELQKASKKVDKKMVEILDATNKEYIDPKNAIAETKKEGAKIIYESLNKTNRGLLEGADKVYSDILNKAVDDVTRGDKSISEAVSDVISKWAEKGVPALVRKDGAEMTPEGYVPMVIRAGQKNLANELENKRLDEYGIDLVMISSHMGSRPSHAEFQGKIYSRSGESSEYEPLSVTGYGKIDGLITGVNCRHLMYPYVEGVTKNNYPKYDLEKNNQRYKEQQYQRKLERDIRKAKRTLEALKKVGADSEEIKKAEKRVRQRQAKIREHIEKTGLKRKYNREKINA